MNGLSDIIKKLEDSLETPYIDIQYKLIHEAIEQLKARQTEVDSLHEENRALYRQWLNEGRC